MGAIVISSGNMYKMAWYCHRGVQKRFSKDPTLQSLWKHLSYTGSALEGPRCGPWTLLVTNFRVSAL